MSESVERKKDVPEGYRQVRLGPDELIIPEEWSVENLGPYISIETGSAFSSSHFNENGDGIPLIRIRNLPDGETSTYYNGDFDDKYLTDLGSILVGMDGNFHTVRWGGEQGLLNQRVARIEADEAQIDEQFLYYRLIDEIKKIEARTPATTVKHLSQRDINEIRTPLPPLPEQRHIADILSTVEEQIQQTEETIERTEELRIGLMNEFFHSGYYDHETIDQGTLGEAPKDWDVCPLSDVASVEMGSSPKSEYYNKTGDGLPFFQANNEFGYRIPTHDRWCSEPNKIAEKGDTLVTIRGTYVGQVNVAPEKCCIGRGLAAVSATEVDQEYLFHQLAHRERYVKSIASGSTFDSINSTELRSLSVQVPPRAEQEKIASCLRNLQQKYTDEMEYKNKLKELKRGLMQDLLTGKVRVDTD